MTPTIVTWGNEVLATPANRVAPNKDTQLQDTIDAMFLAMEHAQGVGIAAPQIGLSWALFIVSSKPNNRYPDAPFVPAKVMINPEIIATSETQCYGWEGCLSIPGIRANIKRHDSVSVRYEDWQGNVIEEHYQGFPARVIQHEYDHLIGKCLFDRVDSSKQIMSNQAYEKQILGYSD